MANPREPKGNSGFLTQQRAAWEIIVSELLELPTV